MQRILSELVAPSPTGLRLPTYPDLQKTALYPQVEQNTYGINSGSAGMLLLRDATFPLWALTGATNSSQPASNVTQQAQQVTYTLGSIADSVAAGASEDVTVPVMRMSRASTGPSAPSEGSIGVPNTWNAMTAGTPVMAVMPDIDEDGWLWVPNGWQVAYAFSLGLGSLLLSGDVVPVVTVEQRLGPELQLPNITTNMSVMSGNTLNSTAVIPSAQFTAANRSGVFIRPVSVNLVNAIAVSNLAGSPNLTIVVVGCSTLLGLTAGSGATMGTITAVGPAVPGWQPLVNMAGTRSASTSAGAVVASACRVVSTALRVTNATKVVNIEGTIQCVRYYENNVYSLALPPVSFTGFVPEDRGWFTMAAGVYTAVRPSAELEIFMDTRLSYGGAASFGFPQMYIPALRLYKNQHIHYIKYSDPDWASGTAVTPSLMAYELKQNLEFVTNDVLLRPQICQYSLEDMHSAVRRFAGEKIWLPGSGVPHYNLVSRATTPGGRPAGAPKAAKPKAAPKPKPKPKQQGEKKKKDMKKS